MERNWDAEWAEVTKAHRKATADQRDARLRGVASDEVNRRYGEAITRRAIFIGERLMADPTWRDPDLPPMPV